MDDNDEEKQLKSAALNNVKSILAARQRAEQELVEAQEALRAVADRLQLALAASQQGDWSWNLQTDEVDLSERAAQILAVSEPIISVADLAKRVHEEDRHRVIDAVKAAVASHSNFEADYRIVTPSGEVRWVNALACGTYGKDGTAHRLTGVVGDITKRKQTHEALRQSEARFRQLADAMPQIVWSSTADGTVDYYNRRWYEAVNAVEGEGHQCWTSVIHPDDVQRCLESWRHSIKTGEHYEIEYRLKYHTGEYRWHLGRALPAYDENGKITRWFGSSTDIDYQKRTEQRYREESRVLELLNSTGASIASTLDLQSLLQLITDASTEMSGAEFGAFFYNTVDEKGEALKLYALSGAPREAFSKFSHPRATGLLSPTYRGEGPIRRDDILVDPLYGHSAPHYGMPAGHLPVRSYMAVPVVSRSGHVYGGLFFGHSQPGVFTERSERLVVGVAGQAAVAIDNAKLYEDVKSAAAEREALLQAERVAREEAEKVSRIKDEFLATLSHELRTPLTAILGWAQVLQTGITDPEQIRRAVDTIGRNARAQTRLIEDLLDTNRIISGKIHLNVKPVNLTEVVNAALDAVRLSAEAKNIRVRTLMDPLVGIISGDAARLQQVFWNLLSNAVKFTPREGHVEVLVERVDNLVQVTVTDSGPGIDEDFLPHIFDRFRQADASTTRAYGGLGLGLSIAKHLVELHGGTIEAKSPGKGAGASFTVCLPIPAYREMEHTEPAQPAPEANLAGDCLQGTKVLVVEDDPDARELVKSILGRYQADVVTLASADEALHTLSERQFHVLVSDIGMPDKDGYQLIQELRAKPAEQGGAIPAIALTAFARPEDRAKAVNLGFQRHASKPVDPHELVATVADLGEARTRKSS